MLKKILGKIFRKNIRTKEERITRLEQEIYAIIKIVIDNRERIVKLEKESSKKRKA